MRRAAPAGALLAFLVAGAWADPTPADPLAWTGRDRPIRRLLLVGFNTYAAAAGIPEPATRTLVLPLDGRRIRGMRIRSIVVPTSYDSCMEGVRSEIERFRPDAILGVGYGPGPGARVEILAANLDDTPDLADEAGVTRRASPIAAGGPVHLSTTLPAGRMALTIHGAGLPCEFSEDAGHYLCNHLFYRMRHESEGTGRLAGFLHVPFPGRDVPPERAGACLDAALRGLAPSDLVVACAHMAIEPGNRDANLSKIEAFAREAAASGAEIAVFPELATSGLAAQHARSLAEPIPGPTTERLRALACELDLCVISGLAERDGETLFNSAVLIGPDGDLLCRYRKQHLYGTDFDWATAGSGPAFGETPWGKIGLLLCHDITKPEAFAPLADAGCKFVALPTNWIGGTDPIRHAGPRAMEHGIPVLVAGRHGTEGEIEFSGRSGVVHTTGIYVPAQFIPEMNQVVLSWIPPGPRENLPPPEAWRAFVDRLAGGLTDKTGEAREQASREMSCAMPAIAPLLRDRLAQKVADPETEMRMRACLASMEEERWLGCYDTEGSTVPFLLRLSLSSPAAEASVTAWRGVLRGDGSLVDPDDAPGGTFECIPASDTAWARVAAGQGHALNSQRER